MMLVPLLSGALAASPAMHGPLPQALAWAASRPEDLHGSEPPVEPAWGALPVAQGLHPVGYHYGVRFQQILVSTMGGPRASATFGPFVAQADVHWRLLDATGRGLPLEALSPTAWRDAAFAGSLLTGERLFDETVERAPALYSLYLVADTLMSPSVDVRRRNKDQLAVTHRSGGPARRAAERAEDELGPTRVVRQPPAATVGVGLDWELRAVDAPADSALIRYTAWLNVTEVGLSSVRFEFVPGSLAWVLSARERLRPRVYLIGSARSAEETSELGRLSGGIMWLLPWRGNWNVRFERIVSLDVAEERWMVTLRCENRTRVPAPLSPPLGDRGLGGPVLPWAPERTPNRLTDWER